MRSSRASIRTEIFSKCMPRQYSWKSKETKVSEGLSYAREWLKYASDIT